MTFKALLLLPGYLPFETASFVKLWAIIAALLIGAAKYDSKTEYNGWYALLC
jgi:hypothetical protein